MIGADSARLLARRGAHLVHSAPSTGVKDWSDLRIAVSAGVWLGSARPGDLIEIISDDRAFDAVGDVAALLGVEYRRLSYRGLTGLTSTAEPIEPEAPAPREGHGRRGRRGRRRGRGGGGRPEHHAGRPPAPPRAPVHHAPPPAHEAARAPAEAAAHTAPLDELVEIVRELAERAPNGAVLIDTLARTLKERGLQPPAGLAAAHHPPAAHPRARGEPHRHDHPGRRRPGLGCRAERRGPGARERERRRRRGRGRDRRRARARERGGSGAGRAPADRGARATAAPRPPPGPPPARAVAAAARRRPPPPDPRGPRHDRRARVPHLALPAHGRHPPVALDHRALPARARPERAADLQRAPDALLGRALRRRARDPRAPRGDHRRRRAPRRDRGLGPPRRHHRAARRLDRGRRARRPRASRRGPPCPGPSGWPWAGAGISSSRGSSS